MCTVVQQVPQHNYHEATSEEDALCCFSTYAACTRLQLNAMRKIARLRTSDKKTCTPDYSIKQLQMRFSSQTPRKATVLQDIRTKLLKRLNDNV
jgi:hypothetical protein